MPFLNLDLDYFDHPKTKRLVLLLGKDSDVLPIRLWSYCGRFQGRGSALPEFAAQEAESIMGWRGRSGEAVRALVRAGFLDSTGSGTYRVHDWKEHQGHIEALHKRAVHAAKSRWSKLARDDPANATSMLQACYEHAPSNAPKEGSAGTANDPENSGTPERANDRDNRTNGVPEPYASSTAGGKAAAAGRSHRPAAARSLLQKGEGKGRKPEFEGQDLGQLCLTILGKDEMARCGSRWRRRAEDQPQKLFRVLVEMRASVREGKINPKNPGAVAEDLWKRFAP